MAKLPAFRGEFIRDVIELNPVNFHVFSPDETNSNGWGATFDVTNRCSPSEILTSDDHLALDGRFMEILSVHQCEGWIEGHLLTGRHGLKAEGPTSTPFDMSVTNDLDRFHRVGDVIDRVPRLGPRAAHVKQAIRYKPNDHKQYIAKKGEDMPEIRNGKWVNSK